ncbi:hypothetical protein [Hymenobacter actinosclerus]|uniref:Uncharacterized protein n=1 Tax=Hymenobacter actinosclerus TaxID=82805 RepID=A0A1I0BID0_9BACT|nr:hypothetical protein [Hymenobacter actinosclerus]SET06000.1 hypothetical protein SAMN04487998_1067 [Hymenobacter actinosclerus]
MTTLEKFLFYFGVALILGSALARVSHAIESEQSHFLILIGAALQFNAQSRYNRRLRQRIEELEAEPRC